MRLLVSVRSVEEAGAAVAGGADIIDAKEPSRGPLGAVDIAVLRQIAAALPPSIPLSAALGDFDRPEDAAAAVAAAVDALEGRAADGYLKLGFRGVRDPAGIAAVLSAAVSAARGRAGIVAAACAEGAAAGAPDPFDVARAAAESGAAAALLDTWIKDGRGLLQWMRAEEIQRWIASARRAGLVTALAGSLDPEAIEALRVSGADVIGVRGAACDAGRGGTVSTGRVARLKASLIAMQGREEAAVQALGGSPESAAETVSVLNA